MCVLVNASTWVAYACMQCRHMLMLASEGVDLTRTGSDDQSDPHIGARSARDLALHRHFLKYCRLRRQILWKVLHLGCKCHMYYSI
jgi:hypothetical protein